MQIQGLTFRFACNQASKNKLTDQLGSQLILWRGNSVKLQCALFASQPNATSFIDDLTNLTSVSLVIRATNAEGAVLINKTLAAAALNGALTFADWMANTNQHFEFDLDETDTNQTVDANSGLLAIYIAISVQTTAAGDVTVATGLATIQEDGIGNAGTPVVADYTSWSKLESDARYIAGKFVTLALSANVDSGYVLDYTALGLSAAPTRIIALGCPKNTAGQSNVTGIEPILGTATATTCGVEMAGAPTEAGRIALFQVIV